MALVMEKTGNLPNGPIKGQRARGPPPALNPESPALVQPYKDFIQRGFITSLNVKYTPMGVTVDCQVRNDLLSTGETKDTKVAIGDAKSRIIEKKLWTPGKQGSKASTDKESNVAPKKSLRKEDFSLDNQKLIARAEAVAKALGDSTARGRIGSLNLMIEGVDTFERWWSDAAPAEKSRLLTDKKHHDTFTDEEHIRLNKLLVQCPFRGPVPPLPQEEEEEQAKSNPTSQALVQKKKGRISK